MTDGHTHSDEYIAIGEAARIHNVSVGTFRAWEKRGLISARRTPTNHRRFLRSEVEALLTNEASA